MRTVKIPGPASRERRERLGYSYRSDTETVYVMDVSHHSVISQHEALFSASRAPTRLQQLRIAASCNYPTTVPVVRNNGLCILTAAQTVRYLYFKDNYNIRWYSSRNQGCT